MSTVTRYRAGTTEARAAIRCRSLLGDSVAPAARTSSSGCPLVAASHLTNPSKPARWPTFAPRGQICRP